jgi:hypothetical protein
MTRLLRTAAALAAVAAVLAPGSALAAGPRVVTGGGSFLFGGAIPMQFAFAGVQHADGTASGTFHHAYSDGTFSYQFFGTVTCLAFDPAEGRAWIGGVLTNVISDDPAVEDPTLPFGVGDDAWFRVLDDPAGDRSTSMGFVGAIPSSAEYCATRPWPADNARTHPVTSGQISVR